ncbi:DUF485 domain-containing protein [Allopusillimonas ginsengisoli]|uniref:DUF485 domain-containing protein n=1 Tax=Allopusillimonas ginsengisoli TaxID=453575 RepID=UPI00102110A2|nr:DUF485 domain-containing protein [Allopusillimonas ginsengisoli]TEA80056.1 DUF485 domain-containing protein [Allopusillimonas ginsengisoli]
MPSSDHDRVVQAVMRLPEYQQLVKIRSRVSLSFFMATLIIYSGFILTLAFNPELFARPVNAGLTISIGVLVGACVTVSAVVLVALYVRFSNKKFDPLLETIARKVS